MKYILCVVGFCCLIACNGTIKKGDQAAEYKAADSGNVIAPHLETQSGANIPGCYMKIVGRDTAILMLEKKGKELSGKMLYDNFEKDGSHGTVVGTEDNEIIKLWYEFKSEGIHSVMEVYFKKENGRLLRGIGDMDVKTDTSYFISGINYSDKETFTKVECDLIKWKLKF